MRGLLALGLALSASTALGAESADVLIPAVEKLYEQAGVPRVFRQGSDRMGSIELGRTWKCATFWVGLSKFGRRPQNAWNGEWTHRFRFEEYGALIRNLQAGSAVDHTGTWEEATQRLFTRVEDQGYARQARFQFQLGEQKGGAFETYSIDTVRVHSNGDLIVELAVPARDLDRLEQLVSGIAVFGSASTHTQSLRKLWMVYCPKTRENALAIGFETVPSLEGAE